MIKEAILAHPEAARSGLSRQLLKKWIQAKYPTTGSLPSASFSNLVGRAITKGAEKKVFVLPKGPSGKVKLAPGSKAEAKKAAAVPTATATTKKSTVAKKQPTTTTAKKPAAGTKKAGASPAAAKKVSSTTKTASKPKAKTATKTKPKKVAAPKK